MIDNQNIKGLLQALKQLSGYFVFSAEDEEFVLIRKKDFEAWKERPAEVQLGLNVDDQESAEDDDEEAYIAKVNQQLASQYQADETEILGWDEVRDNASDGDLRKRVRFESVRGDLPPDLQE